MNKEYKSKILKIAIPIMVSSLISQLQMLIDKIFLGRLDLSCMSAVGNASNPLWTTMNIVFSLTMGATILMSQAIGAGKKAEAKKICSALFKYSSVISVIMFVVWMLLPYQIFTLMGTGENIIDMAVDYARMFAPIFLLVGIEASYSSLLQVTERTKILMVYGVIRSVCNIVLDYIMIFGKLGFPRMEVAGAALATTISEYVGIIIVGIYINKMDDLWLKPALNEIVKADFNTYFQSLKLGLPSALEDFGWNFGNLYLIAMLNNVSDVAAGVYSIVFSIELLPVVVVAALGNATLTVSGMETGKKNVRGIRDVVKISLTWSLELCLMIIILQLIFPETIMSWFTTDQTIIGSSLIYLLIVGIDLLPKSCNMIIGSGIRGYGDTAWMLFTQLIGTVFVIASSSILVLVFHLGMKELFCVVVADETLRSIINYFKLRRISPRTCSIDEASTGLDK